MQSPIDVLTFVPGAIAGAKMRCFLAAFSSIILGTLAGIEVGEVLVRLYQTAESAGLLLGLLGGSMGGAALCLEGGP
jgi:hypothetical protein